MVPAAGRAYRQGLAFGPLALRDAGRSLGSSISVDNPLLVLSRNDLQPAQACGPRLQKL